MQRRLLFILIFILFLSGCTGSSDQSSIESSTYTVNGGVLLNPSITVETNDTDSSWSDLANCRDKHLLIDTQSYLVDLSNLQFYNAYCLSDQFFVDIYEYDTGSVTHCCTYSFSREPFNGYYMHVGDWFVDQQVFTKEVKLIAEK